MEGEVSQFLPEIFFETRFLPANERNPSELDYRLHGLGHTGNRSLFPLNKPRSACQGIEFAGLEQELKIGTRNVPRTILKLAISLFLELCPVTGQAQISRERRSSMQRLDAPAEGASTAMVSREVPVS